MKLQTQKRGINLKKIQSRRFQAEFPILKIEIHQLFISAWTTVFQAFDLAHP